jgi:hypothetical protein
MGMFIGFLFCIFYEFCYHAKNKDKTKIKAKIKTKCLIGVSNTSHTTHDTKDVVVDGIHSDLGSGSSLNSS